MRATVKIESDLIGHEFTGEVETLGFGARRKDGSYDKEIPVLRTDDGRVLPDIFETPAEITVVPVAQPSRIRRLLYRLRVR